MNRSAYRASGNQWTHLTHADQDRLGSVMEAALACQRDGRNGEAARLYRRVLAEAAQTHDALHMLGVIELSLGNLGEAERLILAAQSLQPSYPAIESNLGLVRIALLERSTLSFEEFCAQALPIFCDLVSTTERTPRKAGATESVVDGASLHLIGRVHGSDDDTWCLHQLKKILAPLGPELWATDPIMPTLPKVDGVKLIDARDRGYPIGGTQLFVGIDHEVGEWIERADPDRIIVMCGRGRPSMYLDQLRAISGDGARRIELAFTSTARAHRFGGGHLVLPLPAGELPVSSTPAGAELEPNLAPAGAKREAWTLGMVGQVNDDVEEATHAGFLEELAGTAGSLLIYDPGRYRFALGSVRAVQFAVRSTAGPGRFLSSVAALFCRTQPWWDEGLGREIILAMALGRPVVCPSKSIHAGLIAHGIDGLLYSDEREALELVARLRADPSQTAQMGLAAQNKARTLIDTAAVEEAYFQALSKPEGDLHSRRPRVK